MATSGAEVISLDWRISLAEAIIRDRRPRGAAGESGSVLLLGAKERLIAKTAEILEQAGPTGHIFNLGHGILPPTPVENARALIEFVKSYRHQ